METLEQTANRLHKQAWQTAFKFGGLYEANVFASCWDRKNWRGRVDLCVYWLKRRTQAENNGVRN